MHAIRLKTIVGRDRELHLANVPVRKGEQVEVIILQEEDESDADSFIAGILCHDPTWQWLADEEEDLYSDDDLEESYR